MKDLYQYYLTFIIAVCLAGWAPSFAFAKKVTVVAVVMAEQSDGSSWDLTAGADIILCGEKGCYVSNGLEQPASFYEGSGAFRLIKKAGSCRDSLKCVFRGVDLTKLNGTEPNKIQLVDVDYVSHQYMDLAEIKTVSNCKLDDARLLCSSGIHRRDYSLWVIDEGLAEKAGLSGLDYALFKGVQAERVQDLIKQLEVHRAALKKAVPGFYKLVLKRDLPERCLGDVNFLVESFYVVGLADASKRRAEFILKEFIGRQPSSDLAGLISNKPQLYWAFVDISEQFKLFASAKVGERLEGQEEISFKETERFKKLSYGWQIEARAKTAIQACDG